MAAKGFIGLKVIAGVALTLAVFSAATTLRGQQTLWHQSSREGSAALDVLPAKREALRRLREGTKLVRVEGALKMMGDRISFQPLDGQESLRILENLALERVWRMLDQARGRTWIVSGTVTEYRGGGYLLVSRAVLKSKARTAEKTQ